MLGKISFTGSMFINGTSEELKQVHNQVFEHSVERDEKCKAIYKKINFKFGTVRHDGRFSSNNCTDLFTTKDDAGALQAYFRAQNEITKDHNGLQAVSRLRTGNPDQWLDKCNSITKFYKENISKFVKLPNEKEIYPAKEVLEAIKNGLFDFANLVIKNAK